MSKTVIIDYTNWKGERSFRTIEPINIVFEENEYHKPAQWLVIAKDIEKDALRSFALKDIHSWVPQEDVIGVPSYFAWKAPLPLAYFEANISWKEPLPNQKIALIKIIKDFHCPNNLRLARDIALNIREFKGLDSITIEKLSSKFLEIGMELKIDKYYQSEGGNI